MTGTLKPTTVTPLTSFRSLAFAGPGKKTLYVVGRGTAGKIAMIARGCLGRAT